MTTEIPKAPAENFAPTNELERMLASGVDIGSEEFVVEMLKSELLLWGTASEESDGAHVLHLRTSETEEGDPIAYAFTSPEAFSHHLCVNKLGEEDVVHLSGEDLFMAVGATHAILFNLGHSVNPFFPKASLVPSAKWRNRAGDVKEAKRVSLTNDFRSRA